MIEPGGGNLSAAVSMIGLADLRGGADGLSRRRSGGVGGGGRGRLGGDGRRFAGQGGLEERLLR